MSFWCKVREKWTEVECGDCAGICRLASSSVAEVVPLRPDRASAMPIPPDEDTIEVLEGLLDEARSGKVIGFSGVCFDPQRQFRVVSVGKITHQQSIGGLEMAKFEIMQQWSSRHDK